ncbi:hypothetical protein AB2B41_15855 [Marimonas sp. MJW-29]|uniref:Uncharacterized protein n=1 Tax=Sulfitobacter sediminis TaxID=3234186 RepID=A0ABV3RSQ7_9RHOB
MDKFRGLLITGICAAIFALAFSWGVPTRCVQLPNGMNIGKQAIIDLAKPYFRPEVVPKFQNGKSLLPGDAWPFFTTETTVYGTAEANDADDDFLFVWRMDTGLIRKDEDPARYQRLIEEAGPLLEGTRYGGFGSEIIMRQLQKQPAYADQTCWTRWIAVGNSGI